MDTNVLQCCGITELNGISDGDSPQRIIAGLIDNFDGAYSHPAHTGIVLFTGADNDKKVVKYAQALADYIRKHKLGTVIRHSPVLNRNTKHFITLYVWQTNIKALDKWWEDSENKRASTDFDDDFDDQG